MLSYSRSRSAMSKTSGSAKNENLSTALLSKHLVSVINCKHWDCKIRCSQIVPVTLGSQKTKENYVLSWLNTTVLKNAAHQTPPRSAVTSYRVLTPLTPALINNSGPTVLRDCRVGSIASKPMLSFSKPSSFSLRFN